MNLVTSLLIHTFILNPVRPSITAWPANVPVTEDEMPDERSATANIVAEKPPNKGNEMKKINLKQIDSTSKIAIIILVIIAGYFLTFLVMSLLLMPDQTPMVRMMNEMMGTNIMNFSTTNSIITNTVSLLFGIGLGLLMSLYLFGMQAKDKEHNILRKALSGDEKKIFDEIKRAGEITQDSLRFRLDWSKAKVSTILTNLDKIGLIQRERTGKTYKVYLQK